MKDLRTPSAKLHALVMRLGMACVALMPIAAVYAQTSQLILTTEQSPPHNMSDDGGKTVYGIVADKIHETMRRSKVSYTVQLLSWNRALEMARQERDTCVFSTVRTPERESWFKWVGPFEQGEWMLFGPPGKLGKINKLSQVKGQRIGGYRGDAIAHYLDDQNYEVVLSNTNDITFKNLLAGRLDYWATSKRSGMALIEGNHASGQVVPLFQIRAVDYYLACNPGVDDALLAKLRAAWKDVMADGTAAKIDAKY